MCMNIHTVKITGCYYRYLSITPPKGRPYQSVQAIMRKDNFACKLHTYRVEHSLSNLHLANDENMMLAQGDS